MAEEFKDGLFRVSIDTNIDVLKKEFFTKDEIKELFKELEENMKDDIKKEIVVLRDLQDEIKGEISTKSQKIKDEISSLINEKSQNELNTKQRELDSLQKELREKEQELISRNKDLENLKKELNTKTQELESCNNLKQESMDKLREFHRDLNLELYEHYQTISKDFRERFGAIKDDCLKNFIVTSGSKKSIIDLYENIKTSLKNNQAVENGVMEFFDMLFGAYADTYSLVRLEKTSNFDEELHIRNNAKGREPISNTLFMGFKDGNMTYKSIVE